VGVGVGVAAGAVERPGCDPVDEGVAVGPVAG
jgi:hypothetical protein